MQQRWIWLVATCVAVVGCPDSDTQEQTTIDVISTVDAGNADAAVEADAGPADAGSEDTGPADTGPEDTGPTDTGPTDAGPTDAGPADAGPADAGPADAGPADTGPGDTGPEDVGRRPDSGVDVSEPECLVADDCAPTLTACVVAACIGGDCVVETASDSTDCDDGDSCTSADACVAGGLRRDRFELQ